MLIRFTHVMHLSSGCEHVMPKVSAGDASGVIDDCSRVLIRPRYPNQQASISGSRSLVSPTSTTTIIYTARGRETKPQRTTSSIAPKVAVLFSLKDGYLTLFTRGNLCNIWKRNYLVKKKKRYWKSLRIWRPRF